MKKIILCAENFAFGPIGKLLTVADQLKKNNYELTFIGYGTTFQLVKQTNIDNVIELDTNGKDFEDLAKKHFEESDLIISCMDRASILLAKKLGKATIWLDTLFWWWDEIPESLFDVDMYIKQNSLNDEVNLNRYGNKIKNLKSVGPIVDLSPIANKNLKNQVLVCYGGMEADGWYKVGKDTNYPYVITELLVKKVDFSKYNQVIFTGNERIIDDLSSKYNNEKFIFKTYPHHKFIQELVNSKIVLMTPGLETPLEAFAYDVPTIFLPPSNSSQYVQLDDFRKFGAALMSVHFKDFYEELDFKGKNLYEMMIIFLNQLKQFESDQIVLDKVVCIINSYMKDKSLANKQLEGQRDYIKRLGNNGLNETLDLIENFIMRTP